MVGVGDLLPSDLEEDLVEDITTIAPQLSTTNTIQQTKQHTMITTSQIMRYTSNQMCVLYVKNWLEHFLEKLLQHKLYINKLKKIWRDKIFEFCLDQFFTSYLPGFSEQHALQKEVEILDSNGRHLLKELKGVF